MEILTEISHHEFGSKIDNFCVFFLVMQTYGHDRSVIVMERADPMLLLVSLPLIPVGLIIGQMIRWEETVSSPKWANVSEFMFTENSRSKVI